jgi:DNA-binding PadR family transcriptional regulator
MYDLVLLTALLGGPAYGYALKKTAGLIFGNGELHNNVIYPSLKKFVRNGWVEQSSVPGDRGQQRKQYRITAAGRRYLLEQVGKFGDHEAGDEGAFLLRLALFDVLPLKKREAIISTRRSFLKARIKELSQLHEAAQPGSFGMVALDRVRQRIKNELRWIRQIENELETKAGDCNAQRYLHTGV